MKPQFLKWFWLSSIARLHLMCAHGPEAVVHSCLHLSESVWTVPNVVFKTLAVSVHKHWTAAQFSARTHFHEAEFSAAQRERINV